MSNQKVKAIVQTYVTLASICRALMMCFAGILMISIAASISLKGQGTKPSTSGMIGKGGGVGRVGESCV